MADNQCMIVAYNCCNVTAVCVSLGSVHVQHVVKVRESNMTIGVVGEMKTVMPNIPLLQELYPSQPLPAGHFVAS